MLASLQQLHTSLPSPETISVLVVSPNKEDYASVARILRHGQWRITRACSCQEAREMAKEQDFAVILCERDLPDGNWKDLMSEVSSASNPPAVLVISRYADDGLWSEVLDTGGYDVLPKPFDSGELTRVIGMAWRHSLTTWLQRKNVASAFA